MSVVPGNADGRACNVRFETTDTLDRDTNAINFICPAHCFAESLLSCLSSGDFISSLHLCLFP